MKGRVKVLGKREFDAMTLAEKCRYAYEMQALRNGKNAKTFVPNFRKLLGEAASALEGATE